MNTKRATLDARGWNTSNSYGERLAPRPQRPQSADRDDFRLAVAFYVTCVGFLVAGVIALLSTGKILGLG